MINKVFFATTILALLFISIQSSAQISIGAGTSTNNNIPIEFYYGYTYSQSIYLSSDINASGSISGLEWSYTGSTHSNDIVIYLGHTSKTTFSSTSNWEPLTNLTQVFSGSVSFSSGTISITFDTPFAYNGTDNLIIAVDENTSGWNSSSDEFYCVNSGVNARSLSYYNDNNNPNPSSPPNGNIRNALPNITLLGIVNSCPAPTNFTSSNLVGTSADLSWTDNASTSNYQIEYGAAGFSQGSGTSVSVSSNPYTLTSLSPQTAYDIYLRADCGGGDYSSWVGPINFTTPCAAIGAINETFSSLTIPNCWEAYDLSSGSSNLSSSQANTGTYSWYLYNSYYYQVGMITPELTNLGSSYWLKFHAYSTHSGTKTLQVGTVDNSNNFTLVQTVSLTSTSTWQEFTIDFSAYSGSDTRIMIKHGQSATYQNFYIDDIIWEPMPTCLAPSNFTESNLAGTSADLSWTDNASTSNYQIEYGAAGFSQGSGTSVSTSTNPYVLTGLSPQTAYDVYLRADCGGGDFSSWVGPINFTTTSIPATLPYSQDFESGNDFEFTNGSQTNKWYYGSNTGNTGSSIYISNNSSSNSYSTSSTSTVQAYRDITIPSGTTTSTLSFDWKSNGENNWDYLRVWLAPSSFTPSAGTQTSSGSGRTQIGGNFQLQSTWQTYSNSALDLSAYAGTTMRLIFEWRNDGSGGSQSPAAIDNISLSAPTCLNPSSLAYASVSTNSAIVSFTDNAGTSNWQIEYGTAGFSQGSGTSVSISTNPYTLTSLSAQTAYDVYVRADCGSGDFSDWVGPINFTTLVSCPSPSSLSISNIQDISAEISWTDNASASAWEIEYGATGFSQGTGTVISTNSNPYTLTNLTAQTSYDIYVRANCGAGDNSSWVGPQSLTTACGVVSTFNLTFEGSTDLPECTSFLSSDGLGANNNSYYPYNGSRCLGLQTLNTIYILPLTNNAHLGANILSLYARMFSGTGDLGIGYLTNPNDANTYTNLYTCSLTSSYQSFSYIPTGVPSGAYLALKVLSGSTSFRVDDINWEAPTITWVNQLWSNGTGPTAGNNTIIDDNLSLTTNLDCADLTINTGRTLTIGNNKTVTVYGDLINNGTIEIEDKGALIQVSGSNISGSGTTNVHKVGFSGPSYQYNMWSSPVTAGSVASLGNNRYFYNPANATTSGSNGWVAATGSMELGRGYIATNSGNVTFSGTPNNGPITFTGTAATNGSGDKIMNLIGNPYPCGLDLNAFISDGTNNNNLTGTFYFWDDNGSQGSNYSNNGYATWNQAGGGTWVAAGSGGNKISNGASQTVAVSCQGFVAIPASGLSDGSFSIEFNNSMRTDNGNVFFKSSYAKFWIDLIEDTNLLSQTAIVFDDRASDGIDEKYDAERIANPNSFVINTIISNKKLAVNSLPISFESKIIVPLEITAPELKPLKLSIQKFNSMSAYDIWLLNDSTGTITTVTLPFEKELESFTGLNSHYYLVFQEKSKVSAIPNSIKKESIIIQNNESLYFKDSQIGNITVYTIQGQLIKESKSTHQISINNLKPGIYIAIGQQNNMYSTLKFITQ